VQVERGAHDTGGPAGSLGIDEVIREPDIGELTLDFGLRGGANQRQDDRSMLQAQQESMEPIRNGDPVLAFAPERLDSTELVATSTTQRVKRKKPRELEPQCATKSTSQKPGATLSHSVKVRMGICCLSQVLGRVVVAPRSG
jgi:hypothetical protein